MRKVLFVCHGNICRSPMAEFVFKSIIEERGLNHLFYAESRATSTEEIGNHMHHGTINILNKYNIPYGNKVAEQIDNNDAEDYDDIIVMDHYNLRNIQYCISNKYFSKVRLLLSFVGQNKDVQDPWYTGDFELTYQDILLGIEGYLTWALKKDKSNE